LNSYKLETIIRCADELIGKNSDMPCIAESIKTSIIFCTLSLRNLKNIHLKQFDLCIPSYAFIKIPIISKLILQNKVIITDLFYALFNKNNIYFA
jgi:hypothetical protein